MSIEIKAPQFPESIVDGTVATWHKQVGEAVARDELLVDIETDKVVLEIVAPEDGTLTDILKAEGDTVLSQELLAMFAAGAGGASPSSPEADSAVTEEVLETSAAETQNLALSPAVRKLLKEHDLDAAQISGSGKGGRITKADVTAFLEAKPSSSEPLVTPQPIPSVPKLQESAGEREERRVPMTRLRKRVAERLVNAQQTAAMLTTFNEVNMQPIMDMRKNYQDSFVDSHGVKLGFMSFFVRAAVEALRRFPGVNASMDGDDIVYHGYFDMGVAVSTERGLVVPVIKDADQKGFAELESQIIEYGKKAAAGKLSIEEMSGGTFTISNGGVFGSLLSTPILNPPQTAILGMHKIQQRPIAENGEVVIRPMMYLALSYDHRMIDGKEAVQFLVAIKDFIEDPARLLLDI